MNLPLTKSILKREIEKQQHIIDIERMNYTDEDCEYMQEQISRLDQLKIELNIIECGHILKELPA